MSYSSSCHESPCPAGDALAGGTWWYTGSDPNTAPSRNHTATRAATAWVSRKLGGRSKQSAVGSVGGAITVGCHGELRLAPPAKPSGRASSPVHASSMLLKVWLLRVTRLRGLRLPVGGTRGGGCSFRAAKLCGGCGVWCGVHAVGV